MAAALKFQKATKQQARGRMALVGPAGSGKTYTALAIARYLGARVALIDSERGSASKYASEFEFDVLELVSCAPQRFIEAIQAAEAERYDVLIIDSLSHAWMGKDGALEQVDAAAARSRSGSTFDAWRKVTPLHNQLVDTIIGARLHVIATLRSKTEWVLEENAQGKKAPRKIGLAPVQRDGLEFEFDVVADLDVDNTMIIGKTRCPDLKDGIFRKAGADVAKIFHGWLTDGAVPAAATPSTTAPVNDAMPAPTAAPEPTARSGAPATATKAAELEAAMRGASTLEELRAAGAAAGVATQEKKLSDAEYAGLKRLYGERQSALQRATSEAA